MRCDASRQAPACHYFLDDDTHHETTLTLFMRSVLQGLSVWMSDSHPEERVVSLQGFITTPSPAPWVSTQVPIPGKRAARGAHARGFMYRSVDICVQGPLDFCCKTENHSYAQRAVYAYLRVHT